MKKILSTIIFFLFYFNISSQNNGHGYINPMAHQVLLSGNFGELRSNHFHSGIDYRTESVEGKPIRSIADGYVARIGVLPTGYGNVLYINHPSTGETSVYAHIRNFAPKIDSVTRKYQYAHETYNVDFEVIDDSIFVKKGELIAYSGNSGTSGGPHLHFEIRNTETGSFIDPLRYKMGVTDNVKPKLLLLKIYPQENEGCLDGLQFNKSYGLSTQNGLAKFVKPVTIRAWGKIGLGIKAFDYANNSANILGISEVKLEVDGNLVFLYKNKEFKYEETRYLNSFIDFAEWRKNKSFIMKCFVDEGNFLSLYEKLENRGIIDINEEKIYKIKYTLSDSYGNKSFFSFNIKGVESNIVKQNKACEHYFRFDSLNSIETENIKFTIPEQTLYTNLCFDYKNEPSSFYSDYHYLHYSTTPLHGYCPIALKIKKEVGKDSTKLVPGRVLENGGFLPTKGKFENGFVYFKIRDLGKYVVKIDTIAPRITAVNFSNLTKSPVIKIRISDNLSGIKSYKTYIDNKFVLFSYEKRNNMITYYLNRKEVEKNKNHSFKLIVTDEVGNEKTYTRNFYW